MGLTYCLFVFDSGDTSSLDCCCFCSSAAHSYSSNICIVLLKCIFSMIVPQSVEGVASSWPHTSAGQGSWQAQNEDSFPAWIQFAHQWNREMFWPTPSDHKSKHLSLALQLHNIISLFAVVLITAYRRAPFFQGLQILRISWTSTKFISPKISRNSIVTRIVDWREDINVDSWKQFPRNSFLVH